MIELQGPAEDGWRAFAPQQKRLLLPRCNVRSSSYRRWQQGTPRNCTGPVDKAALQGMVWEPQRRSTAPPHARCAWLTDHCGPVRTTTILTH